MTLRAGVPDPLDARVHRAVLGSTLFAGAAMTNGGVLEAIIPVAGALSVSFRYLCTAGGTLSFAYLRPPPDNATPYGTGNPSNETVVANTEGLVTITPIGEGALRVRLTGAGSGVVTFFDTHQL